MIFGHMTTRNGFLDPHASSFAVHFPPLLRPSVSGRELRKRADLPLASDALCSTPAAGVLASILAGRPSSRRFQNATKRRAGQKLRASLRGSTGATRRKSALALPCRFLSMARSHLLTRSSIVAATCLADRLLHSALLYQSVPLAPLRPQEFVLNKPAEPK